MQRYHHESCLGTFIIRKVFRTNIEDILEYLKQSNADGPIGNPGNCPGIRAGDEGRCRSRLNTLDETGYFGLFCARHDMPLSLVDMFHGERYAYPSFILSRFTDR